MIINICSNSVATIPDGLCLLWKGCRPMYSGCREDSMDTGHVLVRYLLTSDRGHMSNHFTPLCQETPPTESIVWEVSPALIGAAIANIAHGYTWQNVLIVTDNETGRMLYIQQVCQWYLDLSQLYLKQLHEFKLF